ncbi:hypothetical protein [Paraburkholderia xenovorans]|uniref:hypothetical protein n=1 Tax=Paraburkholderia xenovorans TaxID=36873 RepID=UPI00142F373D|nr:hypothetical protein [Paraburkholderia xenovorans]
MTHPFCKLGFSDSGEDSHAGNVRSGWSGWRGAASAMCGKCGIENVFSGTVKRCGVSKPYRQGETRQPG